VDGHAVILTRKNINIDLGYCPLLAHLAEGHESLCHGAASVVCPSVGRRQLFPLNDFFSRTTRPISTKRWNGWHLR